MTQIEAARKGIVTQQMIEVAEDEGLAPELIRERVSTGEIVMPFRSQGMKRAALAPDGSITSAVF